MRIVVDVSEVRKLVEESLTKMDQLIESLKQERDKIKNEIDKKIEKLQFGKYNKEELDKFMEEPYVVIPKRENEFYVIAPRWVDFQLGWLHRRTKSYNIFVINRYMPWISPVPEILRKRLKFPEPLPLKVYDGMLLTGEEHQDTAWNKFKRHLSRREGKDRIKIRRGHEFKLIAELIENGILPFIPRPVEEEDLRNWSGIQLRSYQEEAWDEFLKRGAIGVYWAFGAGKSYFGIYLLGRIKGPKLVVVPTLTLKEQWEERINNLLPEYRNEIDIITYHAYHKVRDNEYVLGLFDEVQHLPANTYIRLSTLKMKYRVGFSGSPFREDQRENYILALTGYPLGMSWDELIRMEIVKQPTFKLYLLKDNRAKIRKLNELLKLPLKTIIFCDSIEFGERIAKTFDIPFIYGQTRERLEIIRNSDICVVSRVGDEGISVPDIERSIEVSFLYGSRMQESQRFGRLMHSSEEEPEHIILMTEKEYEKYQKRLYAIYERGFRIEVIRY